MLTLVLGCEDEAGVDCGAEAGVRGKAGLAMGVDAEVGDTSVAPTVEEGEDRKEEAVVVVGATGGGPRDVSCKNPMAKWHESAEGFALASTLTKIHAHIN